VQGVRAELGDAGREVEDAGQVAEEGERMSKLKGMEYQVFRLFDHMGRSLGKRSVNCPDPQKAYRLRNSYVVMGVRGVCCDCGHLHPYNRDRTSFEWPMIKHEYDHFLGYDCINKILVEEVCRPCHLKRTWGRKARATEAVRRSGANIGATDD